MATSASPAQTSSNAVQVAVRAAAFVSPPLSGPVTVAIVYDPGDANSEQEAREIERVMAGGMKVGAMILSPRRVPAASLDQLAGARMAFITQGSNYRQIGAATAARSILSISFDPACSRTGFCVLAVSETPRVQITVSKAAAAAAKLRFDSSFLMLVKEN
jgi:hypothetical protein